LALDPEFAHAREQLGLAAFKCGEFEQACVHLIQACELDPPPGSASLLLGRALLHLGRYEEAIPALERHLVKEPKTTEAWFRLGQAHLELEHNTRAKECFQKAIDNYADCVPAWFGMAEACERLGEAQRAQECRATFLEKDQALSSSERGARRADDFVGFPATELPQACAIAADVYAYHGETATAQTLWRRAAELDRTNIRCRQSLAQSLTGEKRTDEAIAVFEELQRLEPRNVGHILAVASLHQGLQQFELAETSYQRAMHAAPDNAQAPAGLAQLYLASRRRLPEAQRLAERVVRMQPSAEHFFLLSTLCRANQDLGGARAALREAIRLDPQNPRYAAAAGALGKE